MDGLRNRNHYFDRRTSAWVIAAGRVYVTVCPWRICIPLSCRFRLSAAAAAEAACWRWCGRWADAAVRRYGGQSVSDRLEDEAVCSISVLTDITNGPAPPRPIRPGQARPPGRRDPFASRSGRKTRRKQIHGLRRTRRSPTIPYRIRHIVLIKMSTVLYWLRLHGAVCGSVDDDLIYILMIC